MSRIEIGLSIIAVIEFGVIVLLGLLLRRKRERQPEADQTAQEPLRISIGRIEGCSGTYKGALVPIEDGEEVVIGRDRNRAHLIISNPSISRRHCGIRYNVEDGTYIVTDYSTNGIYDQNGELFPRNTPVVCQAGTVLVLAQSGNEFRLK